tara:strand:+ start:3231 stop:3710 length:480 start_codon:yes stop_codon:yes gene_type:complete
MAVTAFVRPAILKDALELAPKIRKSDREEIRASNNSSPLKALVSAFTIDKHRTYSVIRTEDNAVIGMFGSVPCAEPDYGVAWMLSSEDLFKHTKQFIKECPHWINEMGVGYKYLYNFVDKRNWKSLKWLQYLKFEPKTEIGDYGFEKIPFLLMMKEMNK